ncbi:MAG: T9SS type A sorting domain-containing protein [Candidatus Marinimicrobia bacterium]|nr:T9SS type A sorting domain-containing protein [Candidatus Neomarinimicrobiota bacterium]
MRTRGYIVVLMGLAVMIWPLTAWPQNTVVSGSAFSMGVGTSSGVNTTVQSSAGEVLVGLSEGGNTRTEGGFLVVVQQQQSALAVEDVTGLPNGFALHQNYPNPFNPTTTIQFDLPVATDIHIVVYDLLGREVVRLVERHLEAGYHELIWNARDRTGRQLPSGMYIVLMATPEYRKSMKMLLLK